MINKSILLTVFTLAGTTMLSSCVWQIVTSNFVRDAYPGERPPHVIADMNGHPQSQNWIQINPEDLPISSAMRPNKIQHHEDGIPYGINSEFSDIVISPYDPHYQLDYTGVPVGAKVWDPYTRKPFYIPRAYKFN